MRPVGVLLSKTIIIKIFCQFALRITGARWQQPNRTPHIGTKVQILLGKSISSTYVFDVRSDALFVSIRVCIKLLVFLYVCLHMCNSIENAEPDPCIFSMYSFAIFCNEKKKQTFQKKK